MSSLAAGPVNNLCLPSRAKEEPRQNKNVVSPHLDTTLSPSPQITGIDRYKSTCLQPDEWSDGAGEEELRNSYNATSPHWPKHHGLEVKCLYSLPNRMSWCDKLWIRVLNAKWMGCCRLLWSFCRQLWSCEIDGGVTSNLVTYSIRALWLSLPGN